MVCCNPWCQSQALAISQTCPKHLHPHAAQKKELRSQRNFNNPRRNPGFVFHLSILEDPMGAIKIYWVFGGWDWMKFLSFCWWTPKSVASLSQTYARHLNQSSRLILDTLQNRGLYFSNPLLFFFDPPIFFWPPSVFFWPPPVFFDPLLFFFDPLMFSLVYLFAYLSVYLSICDSKVSAERVAGCMTACQFILPCTVLLYNAIKTLPKMTGP